MTELPAGWAEARLGEVCEIVGGSTPKTAEPSFWEGEIPWLTPDDLSKNRSKLVGHGARSITRTGYESCSTTMVPAGTVLFTSRAPIGYAAVATQPLCTNQGFKSFVPDDGITSDYLYWYLVHATPRIRAMGTGTTFAEISKKVAAAIPVVIAPVAEQHRIVNAIEEQLSRLDHAETSLKSGRTRLDRQRWALLHSATSGPWMHVRLREVTVKQEYGSSAKAHPDGAVPVIRMGNIQSGRITLDGLKYLPADHPDVERYTLKAGDVLFNRTNSPELVGKAAVIGRNPSRMIFASYLIRVQTDSRCVPEWLGLYLNSPRGRTWAASVRTQQVGQANINGTKLANLEIPLPPIAEQRRIVAEVEQQLSLLDSLQTVIDHALIRSKKLRRAILERAFTGRLVPQDPDDEPASMLLDRIRSEQPVGAKRS